jgi:Reverse transcriptase (RNA-dependent DNA polymerase)
MKKIKNRNDAFENWTSSPNNITKDKLTCSRAALRKALELAKNNWIEHQLESITEDEFKKDPRLGWQTINKINDGITGHHIKNTAMKFKNKEGIISQTDKENVEAITQHFNEIYNGSQSDINMNDVLQELGEKKNIMHEISGPPTLKETKAAIIRMKKEKASGPSGLAADAFKSLSESSLLALHNSLVGIFNGGTIPTEWHETNLKCLHKKGPPTDPANWRGICLKEPGAKLLSSILNQRLLKVIKMHGSETQYGSQPNKGCQDGLFVLRSILQTRRHHNLPSWVLFVDLVKAFDTINHKLLFKILEHYGVPPNLIFLIEKLYTGMTININIGAEKSTIPYSIGVQQGDNMAPVLFIFMMLAFTDILEKNWTSKWGLKPMQFNHFAKIKGRLLTQPTKSIGQLFELFFLLYVDDGTFIFDSREELEKGAQKIYDTFKALGLTMHIGTQGNKSKSEAMYISPSLKLDNDPTNNTQQLNLNEGNILFSTEFKYLGSIINNDLKDEKEIMQRIKKGNQQYGALKNVLNNRQVKLKTKILIYIAIIQNTVLWGCESWTLSYDSKRKLLAFQHKMLRKILKINIFEVQAYRITNEQVRSLFNNCKDIITVVKSRQLKWLGTIANMDHHTRMPRKLLACWNNNPRKPGRPQLNIRNSYADALCELIPVLNPNGNLQEWLYLAADTSTWTERIDSWGKSRLSATASIFIPAHQNPENRTQ